MEKLRLLVRLLYYGMTFAGVVLLLLMISLPAYRYNKHIVCKNGELVRSIRSKDGLHRLNIVLRRNNHWWHKKADSTLAYCVISENTQEKVFSENDTYYGFICYETNHLDVHQVQWLNSRLLTIERLAEASIVSYCPQVEFHSAEYSGTCVRQDDLSSDKVNIILWTSCVSGIGASEPSRGKYVNE